jgi:cytochrome c-type biogenesis protein CcmF
VAIAHETFIAVRARRRADAVGWGKASVRTVGGNPRRYGGLIVHLGVVSIAVVLCASGSFGTKREVRLDRGGSATVGRYTVTYLGARQHTSDQKDSVSAAVRVSRGGDVIGVYAPAISTFSNASQGIGTPSVHTGVLDDVYLTLVSSPNDKGRITLGVQIQPLTVWLWIGGLLMALGTVVALLPRIKRTVVVRSSPAAAAPPADETDGDEPEPDVDVVGAGAPV